MIATKTKKIRLVQISYFLIFIIRNNKDVATEPITFNNLDIFLSIRNDSFVTKPHREQLQKTNAPKRIPDTSIDIESATGPRRVLSKVKVNFFVLLVHASAHSSSYMYASYVYTVQRWPPGSPDVFHARNRIVVNTHCETRVTLNNKSISRDKDGAMIMYGHRRWRGLPLHITAALFAREGL